MNDEQTLFGNLLENAYNKTAVSPGFVAGRSRGGYPSIMPQVRSSGSGPLSNWLNDGLSVQSVNPGLAEAASAPAFSFGTEMYARQQAYGHETFKDLGFNILRDNEEFYNQNTGWSDDFRRMSGHWMPGFYDGFLSSYHGFQSLFSGDSLDAAAMARVKGRKAEEHAALAMSTRGGFAQSAVNIPFNLNYTAGIAAEFFVEEAALALMLPETGGASAIPMITRGGQNVWRVGKSLFNLTKNAAALRKVATVRSAYELAQSSRALAKGFATSMYRGTLPAIAGIGDQIRAGKSLTQIARSTKTYADMYRQTRLAAMAIDESAMEAAGTYSSVFDGLYNQFVENNGRLPTTAEQEAFLTQAEKAAAADYFPNLAVIYLTNGITFGNFTSSRALAKSYNTVLRNTAGKVVVKNEAGKVTASLVNKGLKGTLGAAKEIGFKRLAAKAFQRTGNYFAANWAEGAQELFQEGLAVGVEDYYMRNYTDPSYSGFAAGLSSAKRGALSQISQNGLEAFLGGFLGGGIINVAGSNIRKIGNRVYSQFTPEAYEKKLAEDASDAQALTDWINEIGQDPIKLFAPELENLREQASANDSFSIAEALQDGKAFEDVKDRAVFAHMRKLYLTGSISAFKEAILENKNLEEEERKKLFGTETVEQADRIIDTIAGRAESIEKKYDYAMNNMRNPIVMADYKRGTEEYKDAVIKHVAWNRAVDDYVFSVSSFERTSERLGEIYNAAKADPVIAGMSNAEFSVLFNYAGQEASSTAAFDITLEREIDQALEDADRIQRTIEQLGEQAEAAENKEDAARLRRQQEAESKKLSETKDKSEKLIRYKNALEACLENRNGEREGEIFTELREKLYDAISEYLEYVGRNKKQPLDQNKVKDLVEKIRDYYAVGADNIRFRSAVSALTDPRNLEKLSAMHREAIQKVLDFYLLNTEFVKQQLINQKEKNRLITELQEIGVVMSPTDLGKFITDGTLPATFYSEKDSDASGELVMESETGKKVQEILDNYEFVQEEAKKSEEAAKAAEETAGTTEATEEAPAEQAAPTRDETTVPKTAEETVREEQKKKAEAKEKAKAKYQAKTIEKELPSTYKEILELLAATNVNRKAAGAEPLGVQSFINTDATAQKLIEDGYKKKAKAKKQGASKAAAFEKKLKAAATLEEFDDIVEMDGVTLSSAEMSSVNISGLRNQLAQKLGESVVDTSEISEDSKKQMEDNLKKAEETAMQDARIAADVLESDSVDTEDNVDNLMC